MEVSMKLRIEVDLDNAAFQDDAEGEYERIFADVASRLPVPVRDTNGRLTLRDSNGNIVGHAEITND